MKELEENIAHALLSLGKVFDIVCGHLLTNWWPKEKQRQTQRNRERERELKLKNFTRIVV